MKQMEAQESIEANGTVESTATGKVEKKTEVRLGAAMDGAMIYIRRGEWKELKVGCLFEVEAEPSFDKESGDWIETGHAHKTSYVSQLGGPEEFGQKMWTEAKRRDWLHALDTQVVGDAATWIWNLVQTYLYDAHQVVDWYHATEHLALAAQVAFGENSPEALRWFKQQEPPLFQGHAGQVAQSILDLGEQKPAAKEELRKQAGYFTHNKHRMQYLEMRSEGWLIGSGMVESGGKRFKDRFTCSGMRWSRPGAEHLLPVRGAIMSRRFDERWQKAYNSPPI